MTAKTNMQILEDAGAIDSDNVTDDHKAIINSEFSSDEMLTLIKMQKRIKGDDKFSSGAAF